MSTHELLTTEIETIKKNFSDDFKIFFFPLQKNTYEHFYQYLQTGYQGTDWLPLTAAILTDIMLAYFINNQIEPTENKLVLFQKNLLAYFDSQHDELMRKNQNRIGNLLPAAAELCRRVGMFISMENDNNNGNGNGGSVPITNNDEFFVAHKEPGDTSSYSIVWYINDIFNGTINDFECTGLAPGHVLDGEGHYVPNVEFTGTETISYRIKNEHGWSNWATITIHVQHKPTVDDITIVVEKNSSLDIFAYPYFGAGVHSNGTIAEYEFTTPVNGTLSGNTYSPNTDFSGLGSVQYRVRDEYGWSDYATITFEVVETAAGNPFFGTLVDLSSEENQGRITYSLQWLYIAGISAVEITSVELSVPTATPNSVVKNPPLTGMITPSSEDMRNEIADNTNTANFINFSISYTQDGTPKTGIIKAVLPHFSLTEAQTVEDIPVGFVSMFD